MALTFDEFRVDMAVLACKRLLTQFDQSADGIQRFIQAITNQTKVLNTTELSVFTGRTVDEAVGVQLDIIGRIVGQLRPLQAGAEIQYFQWDSTPPQAWDAEAPWFVTNAPTNVLSGVNDDIYRKFILGKVFRNHVFYCSAPEIMRFIELTFSIQSSIITVDVGTEPFAIDIEYDENLNPLFVPFLTTTAFKTDSQVQLEYFLPIAAGVRLRNTTPVEFPPP